MPTINIHNYKTHQEAIKAVLEIDFKTFHQVKITKKRGKRSVDQNALMWMWLTCISHETGQDKDELHDFFKNKYLGNVECLMFGEVFEKRITTTRLDTSQFKQYLDKIQIFASSELGIKLPNPEDKAFDQFKDYYSKFL